MAGIAQCTYRLEPRPVEVGSHPDRGEIFYLGMPSPPSELLALLISRSPMRTIGRPLQPIGLHHIKPIQFMQS